MQVGAKSKTLNPLSLCKSIDGTWSSGENTMRKKLLLIATTQAFSFRSKPKQLSFGVCNYVGLSKFQRRGWSYAASVPSETPDAQRVRKRVRRDERRAMVESFVNKYRAENAGKFPSITDTHKQVGGGFYFVRDIVQELEYKSKMNLSNNKDKILEEKLVDKNKLLSTESVTVSSGNFEIAKDRPIQDDFQLVVLDDKETVSIGYGHLEEKKGPQTSSRKRRLSEEFESTSTPGNQGIVFENNLLEKCSKGTYPSGLQMPNDIKTEEAVSSSSDSVALESQLLQEEIKRISSPFSKNSGTTYAKAQGHDSEFSYLKNHRNLEENCVEKTGDERREQPILEDMSRESSRSSLQVPIDVRSGEAVPRSSDSVASERYSLKEEIEQFSAQFIEKSGSSDKTGQSHESKFLDVENHQTLEKESFEKSRYERKERDALQGHVGVDSPRHKMEQSQRPLELDESKIDRSNNRETSGAVVSEKSTFWGNLKSFADGIINIWKKL